MVVAGVLFWLVSPHVSWPSLGKRSDAQASPQGDYYASGGASSGPLLPFAEIPNGTLSPEVVESIERNRKRNRVRSELISRIHCKNLNTFLANTVTVSVPAGSPPLADWQKRQERTRALFLRMKKRQGC